MATRKTTAGTPKTKTTRTTRAKKDPAPAPDAAPAETPPAPPAPPAAKPAPAKPAPAALAPGYTEQAAQIAADARALADNARHELAALSDRCGDLARVDPGPETAAAERVRRIPMAVDDAARALAAVAAAAAELTAATQR